MTTGFEIEKASSYSLQSLRSVARTNYGPQLHPPSTFLPLESHLQ
jgi:hypothetical protein